MVLGWQTYLPDAEISLTELGDDVLHGQEKLA